MKGTEPLHITAYIYVVVNAIRTPFQGDFLLIVVPRAEALGCFLFARRALGTRTRKCPNCSPGTSCLATYHAVPLGQDPFYPPEALLKLAPMREFPGEFPGAKKVRRDAAYFLSLPETKEIIHQAGRQNENIDTTLKTLCQALDRATFEPCRTTVESAGESREREILRTRTSRSHTHRLSAFAP
jgi:hypothetical protein